MGKLGWLAQEEQIAIISSPLCCNSHTCTFILWWCVPPFSLLIWNRPLANASFSKAHIIQSIAIPYMLVCLYMPTEMLSSVNCWHDQHIKLKAIVNENRKIPKQCYLLFNKQPNAHPNVSLSFNWPCVLFQLCFAFMSGLDPYSASLFYICMNKMVLESSLAIIKCNVFRKMCSLNSARQCIINEYKRCLRVCSCWHLRMLQNLHTICIAYKHIIYVASGQFFVKQTNLNDINLINQDDFVYKIID